MKPDTGKFKLSYPPPARVDDGHINMNMHDYGFERHKKLMEGLYQSISTDRTPKPTTEVPTEEEK